MVVLTKLVAAGQLDLGVQVEPVEVMVVVIMVGVAEVELAEQAQLQEV
jgi:hypothetical protein